MPDRQIIKREGAVLLKKRMELLRRLQMDEKAWAALKAQLAAFEGQTGTGRLKAGIEGLDDQTIQELSIVQEALQKIERGQYGVCELCGQEISDERLAAKPEAERCLSCASRNTPMFGRGPEDIGLPDD